MFKKLANPNLPEEGIIEIAASEAGCCTVNAGPECKYTNSPNYVKGIKGVKLKGGEIAPFAAPTTDYKSTKEAIKMMHKSMGYREMDTVSVRQNGGEIAVYSELPLEAFVYSDDTQLVFTAACRKVSLCDYKAAVTGNVGSITQNGQTQPIAGDFNYTGIPATDQATADDLATKVKAAIDAMEDGHYASVMVSPNAGLRAFSVVVSTYSDGMMLIGAKEMDRCNCKPNFAV